VRPILIRSKFSLTYASLSGDLLVQVRGQRLVAGAGIPTVPRMGCGETVELGLRFLEPALARMPVPAPAPAALPVRGKPRHTNRLAGAVGHLRRHLWTRVDPDARFDLVGYQIDGGRNAKRRGAFADADAEAEARSHDLGPVSLERFKCRSLNCSFVLC
jgi:hypothetical protein